jgi:TnpA family transposase
VQAELRLERAEGTGVSRSWRSRRWQRWRSRCHHRPDRITRRSALHAMITDEHLTVSEAVQWCAAAISQREATRLRKLADTSRQLSQRII